MKDLRKKLAVLMILLLTALFLASCSSDNVDNFPFVTIGESGNDETAYVHSKYRVVVSRLASGELLEAVDGLCDRIEEKTGVYTAFSYDDEYGDLSEGEWLIAVGNVDIHGVTELLGLMRSNDYLCRSLTDMTVIGGRSDSATVVAIERFLNEILPVSDAERLIPEGGGFEYSGDYAVKGLYIGGVSVGSFDIVVEDSRDTVALESAYALRDKISETFGYWLDVSNKAAPNSEKNIHIYTDSKCQVGRAELECVGNGIILKAADRTGHLKNVDSFFSLLCSEGTSGELRVTVPRNLYSYYGGFNVTDTEQTSYSPSQCKIAFTALEALPKLNSPDAITVFRDAALQNEPQLVLLGNGVGLDIDTVKENFSGYQNIAVEYGYALSGENITCAKISESEKNGVLYQVFTVRSGEGAFVLVYVSGSSATDQFADVGELVGEKDLPVVAVSYIEGGGKIIFNGDGRGFFEKVAEQNISIYGRTLSYNCCVDVNRVAVTDESVDDKYGIRTVNIQVS